jgi:glycosyltransferase involved in cell wall biosynthesis
MEAGALVSVVVIFHNAGPFLEEAIASVFAQRHHRWELLLVDDGSTDGSTVAARDWAARHSPRVTYLEHPGHANRGMSAARNLGVRHARGEYVAFLDADDVWLPNILEQQVAILEAHADAAMVYGPIQWWYSWTGRPDDAGRDYVEWLGVSPDSVIPPPRLLPLFLRDRAAVPSGILVRREAFERVGGFEDAFRGEYEDQVFCAKVCLTSGVYASSHCWYRYRQHPDSACVVGQRTGQSAAARLRFLEWLAAYVAEQRVQDRCVLRAVRAELRRARHPRLYRRLDSLAGSVRRGLDSPRRLGVALQRAVPRAGR